MTNLFRRAARWAAAWLAAAGVALAALPPALADLDAYVAGYEFGIRSSGGGVARDPVEAEERRLIIAKLREALTAKGKSWKGLTEEQQDMLVAKAIEGGQFRAQAEQVVAAKRAARDAAASVSIEID